jgi:hypothetical protein
MGVALPRRFAAAEADTLPGPEATRHATANHVATPGSPRRRLRGCAHGVVQHRRKLRCGEAAFLDHDRLTRVGLQLAARATRAPARLGLGQRVEYEDGCLELLALDAERLRDVQPTVGCASKVAVVQIEPIHVHIRRHSSSALVKKSHPPTKMALLPGQRADRGVMLIVTYHSRPIAKHSPRWGSVRVVRRGGLDAALHRRGASALRP